MKMKFLSKLKHWVIVGKEIFWKKNCLKWFVEWITYQIKLNLTNFIFEISTIRIPTNVLKLKKGLTNVESIPHIIFWQNLDETKLKFGGSVDIMNDLSETNCANNECWILDKLLMSHFTRWLILLSICLWIF